MDDLVITRVFDAPRTLVWKAWTDPILWAKWWGPPGFPMRVSEADFRVGGVFHYSQTAPGTDQPLWGRFVYDDIVPVEKLVFRSSFSDASQGLCPNPWNSAWPLEVLNTLILTEESGATTLVLHGHPYQASPDANRVFDENRDNVAAGLNRTLDQLAAYLTEALESDRTLCYHRTFDAPRHAVWKAWTSPAAVAAWWGPSGFATTSVSMDVSPGGSWSFILHAPDGTNYPNHISYRDVEEPTRLVYDQSTHDHSDEFRTSVTFTDHGIRTDLHCKVVFPTVAAKERVAEPFGAEGLKQNMDRFAHWLEKKGLVLTRVFEAPRPLVWKAFTDPVQLVKWWGPEHFTCPGAKVDLHIGGKYLLGMRDPEGTEFWGTGTYREIILNQKLVYTDNFSDAEGNILPASALGLPGDWPDELLVTITFAELGKTRTLVTIHQALLPEAREMTVSGWTTSFDKLARVLR